MKRLPITIKKIKVNEVDTSDMMRGSLVRKDFTRFLFTVEEKGQEWSKTIVCDRDVLQKLRDEIDIALGSITTAETLNLSEEEGVVVDQHYESDPLCKDCNYQLSFRCKDCLFILQSPLERKLYLELLKERISFQTQYGLDWKGQNISVEGKEYGHPENNFKNVLTIADFYIERGKQRLCIYTDGHSYHERTEDQAQHDKTIDRKLQALGYTVLRYTGKEVNENSDKIIREIKDWIGYR